VRYTRNGVFFALIAACLALGPTKVAAQEKIGEISATIDGEQFEFRALAPDASGIEYNTSLQVFGPMQIVNVMGFPPRRVTMRGTIQLTLTIPSGSLESYDQEVIYAPNGMSNMWVSLDGEDLITVEHFEATAAGGEISGKLSGRVCLKESLFAEPDPERCKSIEGTFNASVPAASS
jgi:hypothetical protein